MDRKTADRDGRSERGSLSEGGWKEGEMGWKEKERTMKTN